MLTILAAVFVFGVLVTVHELGHFIAAKLTKMRVEEFAIGFGPVISQTKDGDTEYSLRAIPLGGYNKIAGMDPEDPVDEGGFNSKSIPARMFVILAGALMNFIMPQVDEKPVLGKVVENMAADRAGLKEGDRILTINGKEIVTWTEVVTTLKENGTKEVTITAVSDGAKKTFTMMPEYDNELKRALVGISPKIEMVSPGFIGSIELGFKYTGMLIVTMVDGLQKIVTGKMAADVAGPIGVAQMAGQVAEQGVLPLINFVAFLSINLGVINLLPLPALDGGHFILLLLALTIFSTFKDITR